MYENRTTYPKKKAQLFEKLQELPTKYSAMAIVKMNKVRSSQLLPLRKTLKGEVEILSVKDRVAKKALEKLDIPGIEKIAEKLEGQCIFMFTNMSPFKLNVLLGKNKVMLDARGGDTASIDVVIPPKNTGIAPGPMLTEFKEAGVPTKIDQGTIWIMKESIPVKKGEEISAKLAALLGKLDIKPIEAGIAPGPMLTEFKEAGVPTKIDQGTIWIMKESIPVKKGEEISAKLAALLGKLDIKPIEAGIALNSALAEGTLFNESELVVDVDKFREQIAQAHQGAVSLTIEVGYITEDNIMQILSKASQAANSLSVESGYITDENKEQVLQRAHGQAQNVADKATDYTPA